MKVVSCRLPVAVASGPLPAVNFQGPASSSRLSPASLKSLSRTREQLDTKKPRAWNFVPRTVDIIHGG